MKKINNNKNTCGGREFLPPVINKKHRYIITKIVLASNIREASQVAQTEGEVVEITKIKDNE